MKHLFIFAFALLLPLIVILSLTRSNETMPVEWELAVVNAEERVPANHPTVLEFGRLLDQLEAKCINSRREIAELCIAAHYVRRQKGNPQTLLQFTTNLEEAMPVTLGSETDIKRVVQDLLDQ